MTASSNSAPTQYVVSVGQASAALQPQNPFSGSVPRGTATAGVVPLSLKDAFDRGLKKKLGLLLASEGIPSARGQWWKELSELLPHVTTSTGFSAQQTNLQAEGIDLSGLRKIGVNVSPIVGPFGIFDTRAYLTQSVSNWKSIQQTRSDAQQIRAAQYSYKDARELVVFAVASAYLQTIAGSTRLETAVAAQQSVASANESLNPSLYSYNVSKIALGPAIDNAETGVQQYLKGR